MIILLSPIDDYSEIRSNRTRGSHLWNTCVYVGTRSETIFVRREARGIKNHRFRTPRTRENRSMTRRQDAKKIRADTDRAVRRRRGRCGRGETTAAGRARGAVCINAAIKGAPRGSIYSQPPRADGHRNANSRTRDDDETWARGPREQPFHTTAVGRGWRSFRRAEGAAG